MRPREVDLVESCRCTVSAKRRAEATIVLQVSCSKGVLECLQFRNIMDADVAWMPLTEVLARFRTEVCTIHSDSSSQDESASALTSHCGYGSFTGVSPPSSDEQPDSSQVPTPRDTQSLALTAPPSPEHRFNQRISHKDAFDVTLGRVVDKVAYRSASEGRPGSHHTKNVMKNYVCWCLIPDKHTTGVPEFAWVRLLLSCSRALKIHMHMHSPL